MNTLAKVSIYADELAESVWAAPLGDGLFRLDNQPVNPNYKHGDIVKAAKREITVNGELMIWIEVTGKA